MKSKEEMIKKYNAKLFPIICKSMNEEEGHIEADYADMLAKNQKGAPFDEYGYNEMKTIFEREHPKAYADMVRHSNGLINWQNDGNIFHAHPTAIIDNASIGKNTKIWHFSHICDGANIGENCTIGQNVFIGEGVKMGRGCKIQNNAFIPEGVEIESDVFIGPSVTFTNIINPRAFISRKAEFKKTIIRTCASIGANATILPGITIGRYAMIGAGAVVTKDIGEFQVAFGNPAKVVGTISMDGSRIHYFYRGFNTMPLYNLKELWNGCVILCPTCIGRGKTMVDDVDGRYVIEQKTMSEEVCSDCDGAGRVRLGFEKLV